MEKLTTPPYETPRIEDHGDLTELTAATHTGAYADSKVTTTPGKTLAEEGAATTTP